MLFRKKIDPNCAYCHFAYPADPGNVICRKKGIRAENDHCRKFRYNPLKRVPARPKAPDFEKFDDRDYSL